jgi:hypothetical protein
LPPVLMTANIVLPSCSIPIPRMSPDRLLAVDWDLAARTAAR